MMNQIEPIEQSQRDGEAVTVRFGAAYLFTIGLIVVSQLVGFAYVYGRLSNQLENTTQKIEQLQQKVDRVLEHQEQYRQNDGGN